MGIFEWVFGTEEERVAKEEKRREKARQTPEYKDYLNYCKWTVVNANSEPSGTLSSILMKERIRVYGECQKTGKSMPKEVLSFAQKTAYEDVQRCVRGIDPEADCRAVVDAFFTKEEKGILNEARRQAQLKAQELLMKQLEQERRMAEAQKNAERPVEKRPKPKLKSPGVVFPGPVAEMEVELSGDPAAIAEEERSIRQNRIRAQGNANVTTKTKKGSVKDKIGGKRITDEEPRQTTPRRGVEQSHQ